MFVSVEFVYDLHLHGEKVNGVYFCTQKTIHIEKCLNAPSRFEVTIHELVHVLQDYITGDNIQLYNKLADKWDNLNQIQGIKKLRQKINWCI